MLHVGTPSLPQNLHSSQISTLSSQGENSIEVIEENNNQDAGRWMAEELTRAGVSAGIALMRLIKKRMS